MTLSVSQITVESFWPSLLNCIASGHLFMHSSHEVPLQHVNQVEEVFWAIATPWQWSKQTWWSLSCCMIQFWSSCQTGDLTLDSKLLWYTKSSCMTLDDSRVTCVCGCKTSPNHQSSNIMLDSWYVLICFVWFCPIAVRAITAKHLSLWCHLFKAHSSRIAVVCSDATLQAKLSYFSVLLLFFLHVLSLVAFPNKSYMFSLFLIVMNFNI